MARVIEAVQIFKKVEDVTSAKDDPSPVYIMDELADMARGSEECSERIADRIAKRLQHKSPVVKYKALRLIRHLSNKGCGQFQRTMHRHGPLVRGLLHFKGDPDPYKGDTPNQRVRDAAKDASEALANTVMIQPVNNLGSRIQGFGSSAAPASSTSQDTAASSRNAPGSGSAASSSSRMVGFGSGSYATSATANGTGGSSGGYGSGQKGVNRPLTLTTTHSGDLSGSSGRNGSSGSRPSPGGGERGYSAPPVAAVEVLGSEEQLVDSICTPGGMRLAPDPDDLRRFVETAGSLDGLRVAELLRDKMDASGPWQQQLRALYALEVVLLQGSTQACGEIAVLFQSDPGPVQAAAETHPQMTVRDRAARVLKLLLGGGGAEAAGGRAALASVPTVAAAAPAYTAVDLLDMLGAPVQSGPGGGPSAQQLYPPQQQLQRPAGSGPAAGAPSPTDMFSGLVMPGAGAPVGQQQAVQYAGNLSQTSAAHSQTLGPQSGYQQQGHQQQQQQGQPMQRPGQPYPQPQTVQQPQQQYLYGVQQAAPRPANGADPFELLQPMSYQLPQPTQQQPQAVQPQQQYPQHHHQQYQQQQYQQQQQQHMMTGRVQTGGAMGGQALGQQVYGGAPSRPQAPPQAQQLRNPAVPLDNMFADMNLSGPVTGGNTSAPGASGKDSPSVGTGGVGNGSMYGSSGYGGTGNMYGAPGGAMGSGNMGHGSSFTAGGGGHGGDLRGMGRAAGMPGPGAYAGSASGMSYQASSSQPPPPGASSMGMPLPGTSGGPYGAPMTGPGGIQQQYPPPQQQQQPHPVMNKAGSAGDLLGGYDLLGPGASAPGAAGPGAWRSASPTAAAASSGPYGAAAGMGMGAGSGSGMGSSAGLGLGSGGGGGGGSGGGMVVGPGGQMRYVGAQGQQAPGPMGGAGPMGGMGAAAGAQPGGQYMGAVQGGWQQQPQQSYGMQMSGGVGMGPQQQYYGAGAGLPLQQQQHRNGAAFDFVLDQFK